MALWTMSGTNWVSQLPEGTFRHLLDFLMQNEDNTGRCTNNPDGVPPPRRLSGAPMSTISTIFMPNALPGTTLPIYPGLGKA